MRFLTLARRPPLDSDDGTEATLVAGLRSCGSDGELSEKRLVSRRLAFLSSVNMAAGGAIRAVEEGMDTPRVLGRGRATGDGSVGLLTRARWSIFAPPGCCRFGMLQDRRGQPC